MMSLVLPKSVFLHVPKTGGTWVRRAVLKAGLLGVEQGDFHGCDMLKSMQKRFVFTFVRHPLDWYLSRWRCRHHRQRIQQGTNARTEAEANDFVTWLDRILDDFERTRAPKSHLFSVVTQHAHFVGRQESLADDLITALHRAGERFDEVALCRIPPINLSDWIPGGYSQRLITRVARLERAAFEAYGYRVADALCLR